MPVPKKVAQRISEEISESFARLRRRFLGGGDKQLQIAWQPHDNLAAIYRQAAKQAGGIPLKETQQGLEEIAAAYLDGVEARLRSGVLAAVGSATKSPEGIDEAVLGAELGKLWDRAHTDIAATLDSEVQRARQTGALDGIVQSSAAMGVEDPTVFWIPVRDDILCDECKRLHLTGGLASKPRVWKLSQVSSGYHVRGEDKPSHSGLHPHCRCTLTMCPPGFGFKGQALTYIGPDHDEYAAQQGA